MIHPRQTVSLQPEKGKSSNKSNSIMAPWFISITARPFSDANDVSPNRMT